MDRFSNKVLLCDCVEGMRQLPPKCIPLTITSPPFDGLRQYGGHGFDFETMATELHRITEDGGVVCWDVAEQTNGEQSGTSSAQRLFFREVGFQLHDRIYVAQLGGCRHQRSTGYINVVREVFVLSKGKPRYVNVLHDRPNITAGAPVQRNARLGNGLFRREPVPGKIRAPYGARTNLWVYTVGSAVTKDKFAYAHPALMPEQLAEDLIISYSRPGDVVFDPLTGAGTTLKMAIINGRGFLGMEIHRPYYDLALRRVAVGYDELHRRLQEQFSGVAS